MSTSIDQAFVQQYEQEVKHEFQRRGSKYRDTVRTKKKVEGEKTTFQRIGTGAATTKSRHGTVTPMNLDHTPIACTLSDHYAGDWVDDLDEKKTNVDERRAIVTAGVNALGRKVDSLIVTVFDTTSNSTAAGGTGLDKTKVLSAMAGLGDRDVFEDGRMWMAVGWQGWIDLLNVSEFSSSDFVGDDPNLPWLQGTEARRWLGTTWIPSSAPNELKSGTTHKAFWYHSDAVGHASAQGIKTTMQFHNDRDSWFVNRKMSQGSCMIEDNGVQEIQYVE